MTTEQLNQARAEAWHQASNPLLTADDAAAWLRETGFTLFLPRAAQLATATPSFVEAVLGVSEAAPAREAIETATRLLNRLVAAGDAIALNLMGTPGEQPDFLATPETLPFLFALLGDKEWKRGPRGKSSPLVIEVWKLLDRAGPLTAIEVKEQLGRQLTETAALRALGELWSHLRIEPIFNEGEPARWQLLERNRQKQMLAGSTMSLAVALSALVSLYLQSVVAASGEEIEIFLSPLASRSKVREVVKGLTATRQLGTLNLGAVEMYHVEGSLPEFPEIARPEGAVVETSNKLLEQEAEGGIGEGRRRFVAKRLAAEAAAAPSKPASYRGKLSGSTGRQSARPAAHEDPGRAGADRRPFAPRPGATGGERKAYGTRSARGGSSFNPREPWKEDHKAAAPRESGERRPFVKGGDEARPTGERKPFMPRDVSVRRSSQSETGDRPFKPRTGAKPSGERKSFGEPRPFTPREGRDRKPFSPRSSGDRKPFPSREGVGSDRKPLDRKPFKPRPDAKPFADRKPFAAREGGERKPFATRAGGDRKPFPPREGTGSERKSFTPRSDRPFKPRSSEKPFPPREGSERKSYSPRGGSERKSFAPKTGASFKPRSAGKPFIKREGGAGKPYSPGAGSGKPFAPGGGERPYKPRSEARSDRPARPSSSSQGRPSFKPGKPAFGAKRPAFGAARPAAPGARKTTGVSRARTSPVTSSGKPRAGVRPPTGRPGPRATRGGTAGARPAFKRPGRPGGKGRSK